MYSSSDLIKQSRSGWIGRLGLIVTHLLAFLMLYYHVFLYPSMEEHFSGLGIATTPEFIRNLLVAEFFYTYTIVVLFIVGFDLIVLDRLARSRSRWLSGYSHSVLLLIGFATFVSVAGMITPIDGRPVPGIAPANASTPTDQTPDSVLPLGREQHYQSVHAATKERLRC